MEKRDRSMSFSSPIMRLAMLYACNARRRQVTELCERTVEEAELHRYYIRQLRTEVSYV